MKQFFITLFSLLLITPAYAGFPVIEGQLVDNFGDPNPLTGVQFKVEILAPDGICLMADEVFDNGGSDYDLSATKGSFALALGEVSNSGNATFHGTSSSYSDVFLADVSATGDSCSATSAVGDPRYIRVSYSTDSGSSWNPTATPMKYVGAASAATIDGLGLGDLLKVSANSRQSDVDHIMSVLFPNPLPTTAPGDGTYSLSVSGGAYSLVSSGSGDITDVTAGTGLTGGAASGNATLSLAAVLPAVDGNALTNLNSANLSGPLPAIDGSALTGISAGNLSGALPAIDGNALTNLNSANLSGPLPAIDGSALTGISAGNLSGALPAIDGNALTNLNAANLTGSLPAIDGSALTGISGAVTTVHGRTGPVVSANGDYNASQITNTAAGNIAAVTVQAAIGELDSEKLALAGGNMTGILQMNSANEIRFADADSSHHIGFVSPAVVTTSQIWTLPAADGAANQVLSTDGAGVLSWVNQTSGADDLGNHTATANLLLGANTISNNGTGGLSFTAGGDANFAQQLTVAGQSTFNATLNLGTGANLNMGANARVIAFDGSAANPSIAFAGSTGSGLYRPVADSVSVVTAGVERLRVDNQGRVGIGTTSPNTALVAAGRVTTLASSASPGDAGSVAFQELNANGGDQVIIRAPDALAGNVHLTLPGDDGNVGEILSTNGSGALSWVAPGASDINGLADARVFGAAADASVELGPRSSAVNYSGTRSVAVGTDALRGTVATPGAVSNVAVGWRSMEAVGDDADNNTAVGSESLTRITTGDTNTAIGDQALEDVTTGSKNTALGAFAGIDATGNNNTFLGWGAGDNVVGGSDNIIIGHNVDASAAAVNNEVNIGNLYKGDMTATSEKAVIGGPLLVGTSGAACNAGTHGMLRNVSGLLEVCNGAGTWKPVAAGITDCNAGLPDSNGAAAGLGWVMIGNPGEPGTFCIEEDASIAAGAYDGAKAACSNIDGSEDVRGFLCTSKELYRACRADVSSSGSANNVTSISIGDELVDQVFHDGTNMMVLKMNTNCTYAAPVLTSAPSNNYRCCYK